MGTYGETPGLIATFCIWRQRDDSHWRTGAGGYAALGSLDDPDGSRAMLGAFNDPTTQAYRNYAANYFEVDADEEAGWTFSISVR